MVTVTLPDGAFLGSPATFGASTDIPRPYRWQWYRNGKEIPGASSACAYTSWPLRAEDVDAEYSVKVFGLYGDIEESKPVKLSSIFGALKVVTVPIPETVNVAGQQYTVVGTLGDTVTLKQVPSGATPPAVPSIPVEHKAEENLLPVPEKAKELPQKPVEQIIAEADVAPEGELT